MTMGLKEFKVGETTLWDLDFNQGNSLYNAIVMSLYCNQRDESIDIPQKRGGWYGNLILHTEGFEQGSLIWTLEQSKLDNETAILFQSYIESSLEWLLTDNLVSEINVDFVNIIGNQIEIIEIEDIDFGKGSLQVQITIIDQNGNNVDLKNLQYLSYNGGV